MSVKTVLKCADESGYQLYCQKMQLFKLYKFTKVSGETLWFKAAVPLTTGFNKTKKVNCFIKSLWCIAVFQYQ